MYHQEQDYAQAHDIAAQHPDRIKALVDQWWIEARKYNVLPLDDRGRERFVDPTRPTASIDQEVYRYFSGAAPVPNPSLPVFLNCPHSFTSHFTLKEPTDEGLLVSQGGDLCGWAIFVRGRKAIYLNNNLKISILRLATQTAFVVGVPIALRMEWSPLEVGLGRVRLFINDILDTEAENVASAPFGISMVQEGLQIGRAWGPSIDRNSYDGAFAFTGELASVELRTDPVRQVKRKS